VDGWNDTAQQLQASTLATACSSYESTTVGGVHKV
jgi:hypothetical protein